MPKYDVTMREIEIYIVEDVEADDESEAYEVAQLLIGTEEGKQKYHSDSDAEYTAYEPD